MYQIKCVFVALVSIVLSSCSFGDNDNLLLVTSYSGEAFSESDVYESWILSVEGKKYTLRENVEVIYREGVPGIVVSIEDRDAGLPLLLDVWYGPTNGGLGTKAVTGKLEIQSWESEGVISGVIDADFGVYGHHIKRFWIRIE